MAEGNSPGRQHSSGDNSSFNCPICHNQLNGVSVTHCGHRFCTVCILQWLEHNRTCPSCRKRLTDKDLIVDREFDELLTLFNERRAQSAHNADGQGEQQIQDGRISLEDISSVLQSVMPQRDQDMRNLTDNLIVMKDREITRLQEVNQGQATTIAQLNSDKARLQTKIDEELPGLREQMRGLQERVDRKREQKRQLKDKIQELEASVTAAKLEIALVLEQKKAVQVNLDKVTKEVQYTKDMLDKSKTEKTELKMEMQSCKDELKSSQVQLEKSEQTKAKTREMLERLLLQKQSSDAELNSLRQERVQNHMQILNLQMFETMCDEKDKELKLLREITLPSKDAMIIQLQQQISDMAVQLGFLTQNNIPMHKHVEILQAELVQTKEKLQSYYDEEYGTKITRTEKLNDELQRQLSVVENELRSRVDVGDELKTATKTYKKLVKQNADFEDTLREKEKLIKRLQEDLRHSKGRTHELEQKIILYKRED